MLDLARSECSSKLLSLAGPGLEKLDLWSEDTQELSDAPAILRLPYLTKLVFVRQRFSSWSGSGLQRLQDLAFVDCQGTESVLLAAGALTSLEFLHIEEEAESVAAFSKQLQDREPEAQQEAQQLGRIGDILSELPLIRLIGGRSRLCMPGVLNEQNGWVRIHPGPCEGNGCGETKDNLCEYCSRNSKYTMEHISYYRL